MSSDEAAAANISGEAGQEAETTMQAADGRATDGRVMTTSRLQAWYLVTFRGYTVCARTMMPREGMFKRVRWVTRWFLERGG